MAISVAITPKPRFAGASSLQKYEEGDIFMVEAGITMGSAAATETRIQVLLGKSIDDVNGNLTKRLNSIYKGLDPCRFSLALGETEKIRTQEGKEEYHIPLYTSYDGDILRAILKGNYSFIEKYVEEMRKA